MTSQRHSLAVPPSPGADRGRQPARSRFDPLTGLPGREPLLTLIESALTLNRTTGKDLVAILYLDVHRLRRVNTSFGRRTGDQVLLQVAERLRSSLRRNDHLSRQTSSRRRGVARTQGDEFVVLLSDIELPEDAALTAQRILEVFQEPFCADGREIFLSAHIGIAVHPPDGPSAEFLLQQAETAMYAAKKGTKGFQFFSDSFNREVTETLEMETHLHHALERGELQLHYQPLVSANTGELVGVEALARWSHPVLGLVPPSEFIPVAEDNGLMLPIGEWVLRTACMQVREWMDLGGPRLRLSVNLSPLQVRDENFVGVVADILTETQFPPELLEVELTESGVIPNDSSTMRCLEGLHGLGISLAVDDFGTGNAALGYLANFPLDILKIDRSLVGRITADPNTAQLVAGVIALAHRLDLRVLAEGVETEGQVSFLRQNGCDELQGFLFSRPLAEPALKALVAEIHCDDGLILADFRKAALSLDSQ